MASISETISRLSALKNRAGPLNFSNVPDRLADFDGVGSNPGALRARIFLPCNLAPGAPLVVVLHGCTQTAAGYDHGSGWSRLAERAGFALLFPEQRRENNANLCFNWFSPNDVRRGAGEVLSIVQMIDKLVRQENLDPHRIFITGLSAGGAMAAAMLATYPEKFAAGAIIAGLPYASASSVPEAFQRMRGQGLPSEAASRKAIAGASPHTGPWPRLSVWHGDADHTVSPINADAIVAQWSGVLGVAGHGTVEQIGRHRRQVWRDANGRDVMESFSISGMGHGTPLDPRSDESTAGPFMLDVGISSTLRIAHFWGIADERPIEVGSQNVDTSAPRNRLPRHLALPAPEPEIQWPHRPTATPHGTAGSIKKTIEDALRAAGLMR